MTDTATDHGGNRRAEVWVVLVLVLVPVVLLLWLNPDIGGGLDRTALAHGLLVYPSVLVAGMLLYVCWRMSRNASTAWLAAGVTLIGSQGIGLTAVRLERPAAFTNHSGWLVGVDLTVTALVLGLTVVAARRTLRLDPFVVGVAVGVLATVVRVALLDLPPLELEPGVLRALAGGMFAAQVLTAALLVRLPRSPLWLRGRVGLSIVLLALGRFIITPAPVDATGNGLAIVASVLGTAVLVDTALLLSSILVTRHTSTVRGLHDRVEHLEADVRVDRARLHELGATLAGIANASHLLHTQPGLPPRRRRDLERTVDAEAARLQRLVDRRRVRTPEDTDLDSLLEPLVTAHEARGRVVRWEPTGIKACCCPDDLAEVVNILLENAAQHAGTGCELSTHRTDDTVEIRVSDRGPGVPAELAPFLFTWGRRGPGSSGQGIGLHIAHRLMVEQGGDLRLATPPGCRGATFVACLPAATTDWDGPVHDPSDDA